MQSELLWLRLKPTTGAHESFNHEAAMEPQYKLIASALFGVFAFLFFLARKYWRSLGWMLGPFDPNLGFSSEAELISAANRTVMLIGALLVIWAIVGPSPYRGNWEIEAMGLALGAVITYLLTIRLATSRSRAKRR